MFKTTKEQVKLWHKDKVIAIAKQDEEDINVYGLKFKDDDKAEVEAWLSENLPGENFKLETKKKKIKAVHYIIDTTNTSDGGMLYGTEHVTSQSNGVTVRVNVDPSPEYRSLLEERQAQSEIDEAENQKLLDKEKKIQDKMRELAISELEKEGAL